MNPTLVNAVRLRMAERSTDELLDLWVTNDRATYSPEAFEAVRSLLVERGVAELPPQSAPAPLARPSSPHDDPEATYWMQWLRPVLWIGLGLACVALLAQAAAGWAVWEQRGRAGFRLNDPINVVTGAATTVLMPVWLLAASIGCLRRSPAARLLLLVYGWVAFLTTAAAAGHLMLSQWQRLWWAEAAWFVLMDAETSVHRMVFPLVLVLLLHRPEIRSVFVRRVPGFVPSLTDPAAAPAALADAAGGRETTSQGTA